MLVRPGRPSVRGLMAAVAFVALAIAWSSRWSDWSYRAAFHDGVAADRRSLAGIASNTAWARDHLGRKALWHEEMARRYRFARWLPWPFLPAEPPGPR